MKCEIVKNRLSVSTEALKVLLSIAWTAAKANNHPHPFTIRFNIGPSCSWRLRFNRPTSTAFVLINEKAPFANVDGMDWRGFNEVFVGLAAWAIAGFYATRDSKTAASTAIYHVREMGETLAAKMAAAEQRVQDREGQAFARQVMVNMERNSLEFKLKRLGAQEKTWLRKARLAETKLKGLRRRRSALLAAAKRREAVA